MGFLFALSMAIPTYISSTFLSSFVSEKTVGIFYTIASLLTILVLVWIPVVLRKIGNYKIFSIFLIIDALTLLIISFSEYSPIIILAFIIHITLTTIITFNLDVLLESFSENKITGHIRGSYLSLINIAWLISPLVAGFILTDNNYWKVYTISAALIIPIFFLLFQNFRKFKDPKYEKHNFLETLNTILKRKNIFRIFMSQIILRFFYAWMIIYTPIYLHQYIGFSWGTIGIIFTIMLLPFVLLELPLGRLADNKLGEKEILNIGFIIMGLSTASLTFITSANPIIWAMLLFTTRVGASMTELSSESYFFKKISSGDTNILSLFRMTGPIAYVIGPLLASLLLIFVKFNYLFIILGIIVITVGLFFGLKIKDTK